MKSSTLRAQMVALLVLFPLAVWHPPVRALEAASSQERAATATPAEKVNHFHTALLAIARLDADFDARMAQLALVFDQVFDLPRIARISVGSAWRTLDESTRLEYSGLLREVLLATYVSRFDADRGQRLSVVDAREVKPGRDLVRSKIVRPSGQSVTLDYYLRNGRIFSVEADGVSDLSIRRTDYTSTIDKAGFEGLLDQLRQQVQELRSNFANSRGASD